MREIGHAMSQEAHKFDDLESMARIYSRQFWRNAPDESPAGDERDLVRVMLAGFVLVYAMGRQEQRLDLGELLDLLEEARAVVGVSALVRSLEPGGAQRAERVLSKVEDVLVKYGRRVDTLLTPVDTC